MLQETKSLSAEQLLLTTLVVLLGFWLRYRTRQKAQAAFFLLQYIAHDQSFYQHQRLAASRDP